tara:strand:- start:1522 stop:2349 length:828 start_codon:yes stop_codon:yes gene_type:complete
MELLIPKFNPFTWFCLSVFYVLCLVYGGDPNPDFVRAEWLTLLALGTAAATSIGSAVAANKRAKQARELEAEGMKLAEKQEKQRRADIKDAFGDIAKEAEERREKDDYGLSQAEQREIIEEGRAAIDAQQKTARAELERGEDATPFGSGRRQALKQALAESGANEAAKLRLGAARFSDEIGEARRREDVTIGQNYASMLGGLPASQLPGMAFQQAAGLRATPSGFERGAQVGLQGLTAAGTMGAFDKKAPTAPAPTDPGTPIDQQIDAEGVVKPA